MEQWSILSNVINYMQYSKNHKNFHAIVMYSSDVWFLGLSRGIGSHGYYRGHHDTQCLSLGSIVFAHLGGMYIKT